LALAERLNAQIEKESVEINNGEFSDNSELHDIYINNFITRLVKKISGLHEKISAKIDELANILDPREEVKISMQSPKTSHKRHKPR